MTRTQETIDAIYSVYTSEMAMENFSVRQMDALIEAMRAVESAEPLTKLERIGAMMAQGFLSNYNAIEILADDLSGIEAGSEARALVASTSIDLARELIAQATLAQLEEAGT